MVLTLPQVLCKLGSTLAGAEDTAAVDEAISTLDKVRLAAFTNDIASIDCKPSVLGSDSLIPGDLFLYNECCDNGIKKGPRNVHMVSGLRVVGGAMLETPGFHGPTQFPVSVLYSERSEGVVLHAGSVPFASLEADFYDRAFEKTPLWETKMLGDEAGEFMAWRREAAVGSRCAGLAGTPAHLFEGKDYHILRYGVTPFMSLRAPANEAEAALVVSRLCSDIQVIPCGDLDYMQTYKEKSGIIMAFVGESAPEITPNKDLPTVEFEERLRIARSMVSERPILSWLSAIILHNAVDDAVDAQGEQKNEYRTGLEYNPSNDAAIRSVYADELRSVKDSSVVKCSDLETAEIRKRGAYTLGSVMRGTGRLYATKPLVSNTLETNTRAMLEAIAIEAFDPSDAHLVAACCFQNGTDHMTLNTAISVLGKCLATDQALAILTREQDGRISNAKLVGKDLVVANIYSDAVSRLLLFPWVTFVIIDKESVSLLEVKEPEGVDAAAFARNKLRLCESVKPRVGIGDTDLATTVVDLKSEVAELKNANLSTLGAIKDFERKLNLLVEMRFEAEPASQPPSQPAVQPPSQPPSQPASQPASHMSGELESLKRTLDILMRFEKRQRSV